MATSNYFEKLKDPRWQKKRLEVLASGDWTCEQCGGKKSTLHVHHRQYFRGREPWDYEVGQLAVLCEECHTTQHEAQDPLLTACSFVVSSGMHSRQSAASLVAGFCGQDMCSEHAHDDPDTYLAGAVASVLSDKSSAPQLFELLEAISARNQYTVRAAIRSFITDLKNRADVPAPVSISPLL